jgi:hypothetical protein
MEGCGIAIGAQISSAESRAGVDNLNLGSGAARLLTNCWPCGAKHLFRARLAQICAQHLFTKQLLYH